MKDTLRILHSELDEVFLRLETLQNQIIGLETSSVSAVHHSNIPTPPNLVNSNSSSNNNNVITSGPPDIK